MADTPIPKNQIRSINKITEHEHEDDLDAKRVTIVGEDGESGLGTTPDNPLYTQLSDGSITIGTVNAELEVQLSHQNDVPNAGDVADSVRIGDGVTEAKIDPLNQSFSTNRYEKLLGVLANANWMKLGDFDAIVPLFSGNVATLEYKQNAAIIGRAICTFVTDSNWNIVLERYINDTDGDQLLDDDGSYLFLD